ncbi:MAG: zinc finger domain-containing protein, partial [Candidatus Omnitrophica bacterium]|nr:zinc finger domain-containing protein [Candidatus Omnitrophota bacterium]
EILERDNQVRVQQGKQPARIPQYFPDRNDINIDVHNTRDMLIKEMNKCVEHYGQIESIPPPAPNFQQPRQHDHQQLLDTVTAKINQHEAARQTAQPTGYNPPVRDDVHQFATTRDQQLFNDICAEFEGRRNFNATPQHGKQTTPYMYSNSNPRQQVKACFNCGSTEHLRKNCPQSRVNPALVNNHPKASTPAQHTPPPPGYATPPVNVQQPNATTLANEVRSVLARAEERFSSRDTSTTNSDTFKRMLDTIPTLKSNEPHLTLQWLKTCSSIAESSGRPLKEVCAATCDDAVRLVVNKCRTDNEVWDRLLASFSDAYSENELTAKLDKLYQKEDTPIVSYNHEYTAIVERMYGMTINQITVRPALTKYIDSLKDGLRKKTREEHNRLYPWESKETCSLSTVMDLAVKQQLRWQQNRDIPRNVTSIENLEDEVECDAFNYQGKPNNNYHRNYSGNYSGNNQGYNKQRSYNNRHQNDRSSNYRHPQQQNRNSNSKGSVSATFDSLDSGTLAKLLMSVLQLKSDQEGNRKFNNFKGNQKPQQKQSFKQSKQTNGNSQQNQNAKTNAAIAQLVTDPEAATGFFARPDVQQSIAQHLEELQQQEQDETPEDTSADNPEEEQQ